MRAGDGAQPHVAAAALFGLADRLDVSPVDERQPVTVGVVLAA